MYILINAKFLSSRARKEHDMLVLTKLFCVVTKTTTVATVV